MIDHVFLYFPIISTTVVVELLKSRQSKKVIFFSGIKVMHLFSIIIILIRQKHESKYIIRPR